MYVALIQAIMLILQVYYSISSVEVLGISMEDIFVVAESSVLVMLILSMIPTVRQGTLILCNSDCWDMPVRGEPLIDMVYFFKLLAQCFKRYPHLHAMHMCTCACAYTHCPPPRNMYRYNHVLMSTANQTNNPQVITAKIYNIPLFPN